MTNQHGNLLARLAFVAIAGCWVTSASSQTYPTKPIRILTSAAGGPYDVVMRGFSVPLGQNLGQAVVIENRTGANYLSLGEGCAKAEANGYTLCTGDAYTTTLNPHAFSRRPYSVSDFTPIIHFGWLYSMLLLNPKVPANSVKELFAMAKAKPNSLTFGTPGLATNAAIYVEYLRKNAGVEFLNVPYKNFVDSFKAVISGEIDATLFAIGPSMAMAKSGKLKAIAVTGGKRSQFAPDLPTFEEAGIDITIANWGGIMGPAGLPREVISRIHGEWKKLMQDPVMKEKYLDRSTFEQAAPAGGTPEEFAAFLQVEDAKFQRLVKITNLRLD